jgi:hypothetical protein
MGTVTETLIVLEARGQFWAGLVLHNDLVIDGADILKYMTEQHWTKTRVCAYAKSRGWKCSVVHEIQLRRARQKRPWIRWRE